MKMKADISTPVKAYTEMSEHWVNVDALKEGELEIKEHGEQFLPREPAENHQAYLNRLKRSSLFNVYRPTVQALSGEPFTRPIILTDVPEELDYLQNDADSTGRSLTNLARDLLIDILHYGKAHILVDYPTVEGELTVADLKELQIRPYFVQISPKSLIGWKVERVGAVDKLTSIRILSQEVQFSETNQWEEQEVEVIRHYTPESFEIYHKKGKDWVLVNESPNGLGKVCLVTIYANKKGTLVASPPLEDLANLNIRHYQKLSDLDNIEHIANVPLLFGSGFTDQELDGIQIGPNRLIGSTDPNADLRYVEHSGAAISASQNSLKEIEGRMFQLGASILVQRNQQRETATARLIDKGEMLSDLQVMVRNLEAGISQAYNYAGEWVNLPDVVVKVDIGDSNSIPVEANATQDLINLLNAGILTPETLVDELKRRGVLSATFNKIPDPIQPVVQAPIEEDGSQNEEDLASEEEHPSDMIE